MGKTLHRIPACITMHRRSPAKLPDVCRDPPAREVSLTSRQGPHFQDRPSESGNDVRTHRRPVSVSVGGDRSPIRLRNFGSGSLVVGAYGLHPQNGVEQSQVAPVERPRPLCLVQLFSDLTELGANEGDAPIDVKGGDDASEAVPRRPSSAGARRCQRRSCSLRCACSTLTPPTRWQGQPGSRNGRSWSSALQ
jgi:hypothetical protein